MEYPVTPTNGIPINFNFNKMIIRSDIPLKAKFFEGNVVR